MDIHSHIFIPAGFYYLIPGGYYSLVPGAYQFTYILSQVDNTVLSQGDIYLPIYYPRWILHSCPRWISLTIYYPVYSLIPRGYRLTNLLSQLDITILSQVDTTVLSQGDINLTIFYPRWILQSFPDGYRFNHILSQVDIELPIYYPRWILQSYPRWIS